MTTTTCPKCGEEADQDEGYAPLWGCGTTTSPKGLIQSSQCKDQQITKLEAELAEVRQEVADWTVRAKSWESIRELTRTEREEERRRAESAEAEAQSLRERLAAVKKRLDLSHCFQESVAEIKLS